jgi:hypothetical protein
MPAARQVLRDLLAKYAEHGPSQQRDLSVLEVDTLSRHGSPVEIAGLFGCAEGLRKTGAEREQVIYAALVVVFITLYEVNLYTRNFH